MVFCTRQTILLHNHQNLAHFRYHLDESFFHFLFSKTERVDKKKIQFNLIFLLFKLFFSLKDLTEGAPTHRDNFI